MEVKAKALYGLETMANKIHKIWTGVKHSKAPIYYKEEKNEVKALMEGVAVVTAIEEKMRTLGV